MKHNHAIGILLILLISLLASSIPARAEKISLTLDWILNGKHAPFFIGFDRGLYKSAGIDITIKRGFGSSKTVASLAANSTDYGFADTGSVIIENSGGGRLRLLAILHERTPHVIYSLGSKGIWTPADLKGKSIGAPVGDAVRAIFPAFARATGLDPKKDIRWVTITGAAKPASLLTGQVDAITNYVTDGPPLIQEAAKVGKKISVMEFADWGIDIYSNGIVTQDSRVRTNPVQVKRIVGAIYEGMGLGGGKPGRNHPGLCEACSIPES